MSARQRNAGRVYLVGAGPGDPDLLTVKAVRLIREADVVVYDRLVSPRVLALVPVRGGEDQCRQGDRAASGAAGGDQRPCSSGWRASGRTVVRLKGGDPFIFGRGGEEALELCGATTSRSKSCRESPRRTGCAAALRSAAHASRPGHRRALCHRPLPRGRCDLDLDWRGLPIRIRRWSSTWAWRTSREICRRD